MAVLSLSREYLRQLRFPCNEIENSVLAKEVNHAASVLPDYRGLHAVVSMASLAKFELRNAAGTGGPAVCNDFFSVVGNRSFGSEGRK